MTACHAAILIAVAAMPPAAVGGDGTAATLRAGARSGSTLAVAPSLQDARSDDAPQSGGERPPALLVAGGREHLWIVHRRDGRARLAHIATTMPPGEYREAAPLPPGVPEAIAAWEERVYLLYPGRSAAFPRAHLLGSTAHRHPTTGLWLSIPVDRLELLPALPRVATPDESRPDPQIESFVASSEGPLLLHRGDSRIWRLRRGEWSSIELPTEVAGASRRRLEVGERELAVLADSGDSGRWERWTLQGESWSRASLEVPPEVSVQPVAGSHRLVLVDGAEPRIAYLPDDGILELAELRGDEAVAWFARAPVTIRDGPVLVLTRIDAGTGEREAEMPLRPRRAMAAAWFHLPIIGAVAIAVLMVVFFVRALREPRTEAPSLPPGTTPLPMPARLIALAVDLVPGMVGMKLFWGVPWSSLLIPPAFVLDVGAAVPSLAALLASVVLSGGCEAIFGRSLGKLLVRGGVVSCRPGAAMRPAFMQTFARNVFKAVILQMPLLGLFTLLDPMRRGVGEAVSATAVVRFGDPVLARG